MGLQGAQGDRVHQRSPALPLWSTLTAPDQRQRNVCALPRGLLCSREELTDDGVSFFLLLLRKLSFDHGVLGNGQETPLIPCLSLLRHTALEWSYYGARCTFQAVARILFAIPSTTPTELLCHFCTLF